MHRILVFFIIFSILLVVPSYSLNVELYLAPNGGLSSYNNHRIITTKDGHAVKATLNNALLDVVSRVPRGGAIKIVMYNFNYKPLYKLLIKKALKENVQVKVILDNCAGWTKKNVNDFVKGINKIAKRVNRKSIKFDFQVKVTTRRIMSKYKRTRILSNGKEIFGTMHEKFGIFYNKKLGKPVSSFAGSSNISPSADKVFVENRIFFKNSPIISQVWANQFARLWNFYSEKRTAYVTPEYIENISSTPPFRVIFNGKHKGHLDSGKYDSIDTEIMKIMDEVTPDGSMDVMMFSFTHWGIKNKILEIARKYPKAKIHLLFDHSMLTSGEDRKGLMPPLIEEAIKKEGLKNIEIRYRFRANAYGYIRDKKVVELDHFRSPLLHDKLVIVNRNKMIFGSYNWSESAEKRNFEDVMVFDGKTEFGNMVINRFLHEFDFLWNHPYSKKSFEKGIKEYVATGKYAKKQEKIIINILNDYRGASKVRYLLDRYGPMTISKLKKLSHFKKKGELGLALSKLIYARLVTIKRINNKLKFQLAD